MSCLSVLPAPRQEPFCREVCMSAMLAAARFQAVQSRTAEEASSSSQRPRGRQQAACRPLSRARRGTVCLAGRDDAGRAQEVDFDRVEKENAGNALTSLASEAESVRDSYADTVGTGDMTPADLVMKDLSYTYKRVQDDTQRAKRGLLFSKELLVWALGLGQQPQLLEKLEKTRAELQEADQQSFLSEVRLQYTVKRMEELEHKVKSLNDGTLRTAPKPTATAVGPVAGPPTLDVGEFPSEAWCASPESRTTTHHRYPVAHASRLLGTTLIPFDMFGRSWVTFREANNIPATVLDECSHRACPLSLGKNVAGKIQCPYHGWEYDGTGACVKMPSCHFLPGIAVAAMTSVEHDGFIWVWAGSGMPALKLPNLSTPPGFRTVAEISLDVEGDARTVLAGIEEISRTDNLRLQVYKDIYEGKDAPASTGPADVFAHALARAIRNTRRQSPSTVRFEQPAAVVAENTIDFPGLGKYQLHTMHAVFPARPGRCRLLFRMATDVSGALSFAPGMATFWEALAEELVNEELRFIDKSSRRAY